MRRPLLSVACLAAIAAIAAPAYADCALDERPIPQQIAESPVVFVGTVTAVDRSNIATIQVEERWKGTTVPAQVRVDGEMHSENRMWVAGTRYLVFPIVTGGDPPFSDNGCSATREWTDDLVAFRPAAATPEPAPSAPGDGRADWLPWVIGGAVLAVLIGTVLVPRRRLSSPTPEGR